MEVLPTMDKIWPLDTNLSTNHIIPAWPYIKYAVGQIPINPSVTNLTEGIIIGNLHKYTRSRETNTVAYVST